MMNSLGDLNITQEATKEVPLSHVTKTVMEDERGKKLLSNLKAAFSRDRNIEEYDYLPVLEPTHNCNPMILVDHRLGVELWASKVLFDYAYQRLIQWKRKLPRTRGIDPCELQNLSRAVLLFNADNATAWNVRKELVQNKNLTLSEDLQLCHLILSKHPKSPESFAHRKWLLSKRKKRLLETLAPNCGSEPNSNLNDNRVLPVVNVMSTSDLGPGESKKKSLPDWFVLDQSVRDEVQREMSLSTSAAEKYSNNYNAWSHRIWTLQQFTGNHPQILTSELQKTEKWTSMHVSDYSGFHYRQYLLSSLGNHSDQLDIELSMTSELIERYPGHEALWCHRRFIVQSLLNHASASSTAVCRKAIQAVKKTRILPHREMLLEGEEEFCNKTLQNSKNKWQNTLTERYRVWLRRLAKDN